MIRKMIQIEQEKCNGCGACAAACHEGAIDMVNGKAQLLRDDYCDGLGDCLPVCPTGAITFTEREAAPYDKNAVDENKKKNRHEKERGKLHSCPGSQVRKFLLQNTAQPEGFREISRLSQWPVQIKLVPVNASYFEDAKLLIAADCTAYAYAGFHERFMKGCVTLIGCPKLDSIEYAEKLTEILRKNNVRSVTVVRMEVPCCGGIEYAVKKAVQDSGKFIPWQAVTISAQGQILG